MSWAKLYAFERQIVRTFDGVSAVSDKDRDHLRALVGANDGAGDKVVTVPNGVDLEAVTRFDGKRVRGQLVYPGSLTYEPNMDACVWFVENVMPRIRKERPDARLVITGKLPANVPEVLRDVASVDLRGLVPSVQPVVGESDVCVVPLRRGGGTRLKILEAFAIGTPIVSTTIGAEGIAARSGEHLVLADSPDAFAREVIALLGDDARRARLADAGRGLVEREYAWERVIDKLDDLLNAACSRRRAAR
jgi:glycosyltransferase involved in cell wall biosynthesis